MRIGVLGAGQLALMLGEAARALTLEVICAGSADECAAAVLPLVELDLNDPAAVAAFAASVDAVTIESENTDAAVLRGLPLYPNVHAIATAQDRLAEKTFLRACGVPTAPFASVDSLAALHSAVADLGVPSILKTRRMGYDGKGQARLHSGDDAAAAWDAVEHAPSILEGFVHFDAEVSLVAARGRDGTMVALPLAENIHRDGILRRSDVPSRFAHLQGAAERTMAQVMQRLEYVGVLAIEFFVAGDALVANEMAPRVHNSGHWSIEGADVSQFGMHLRAMAGLPLTTPAWRATTMLNCIGSMPALAETAAFPEIARHDYGKQPRPGRKVGHLTIDAAHAETIRLWDERLRATGG